MRFEVPLSRKRAHVGEDGGQPLLPAEKITNLVKILGLLPNQAHSRTIVSLLWLTPPKENRQRLSYAANVTEVDVSLLRPAPTDKHRVGTVIILTKTA